MNRFRKLNDQDVRDSFPVSAALARIDLHVAGRNRFAS